MQEIIHNVQNDEIEIRDFTAEEIAQHQKNAAESAKFLAQLQSESEAKAAQRAAILERLGLTAEEAAILLG